MRNPACVFLILAAVLAAACGGGGGPVDFVAEDLLPFSVCHPTGTTALMTVRNNSTRPLFFSFVANDVLEGSFEVLVGSGDTVQVEIRAKQPFTDVRKMDWYVRDLDHDVRKRGEVQVFHDCPEPTATVVGGIPGAESVRRISAERFGQPAGDLVVAVGSTEGQKTVNFSAGAVFDYEQFDSANYGGLEWTSSGFTHLFRWGSTGLRTNQYLPAVPGWGFTQLGEIGRNITAVTPLNTRLAYVDFTGGEVRFGGTDGGGAFGVDAGLTLFPTQFGGDKPIAVAGTEGEEVLVLTNGTPSRLYRTLPGNPDPALLVGEVGVDARFLYSWGPLFAATATGSDKVFFGVSQNGTTEILGSFDAGDAPLGVDGIVDGNGDYRILTVSSTEHTFTRAILDSGTWQVVDVHTEAIGDGVLGPSGALFVTPMQAIFTGNASDNAVLREIP